MRNLEISYIWNVIPLVIFYCMLSARSNLADNAICQQDGVCTCVFDNRSKIDLSPLGSNTGVPLIKDLKGDEDYVYSFNPCYPFNEGTCLNVAACQTDPGTDLYYAIGDSSDPLLTYNTSSGSLIGRYSSISDIGERKTSYVSFICDPAAETPQLQAFGESPMLTYRFAITSKHACITQKPTPPTPTKSCHTNYGDFIKRCEIEYDGHDEPVKVLFIRNWNGKCKFPSNKDVAVTLYTENLTCAGVTNRCSPTQAFSVNGEVCKEINY